MQSFLKILKGSFLWDTLYKIYFAIRIPASWNCFFDGCYKDFENIVDSTFNTNNNNLCTNFGFVFTSSLTFRTRLKNIVNCYLFLVSNNGFHISGDKNVVALMVTYSLIFLEKTSETYSGKYLLIVTEAFIY